MSFRPVAGRPDYLVEVDGVEVHRCTGPTIRVAAQPPLTSRELHPSTYRPKQRVDTRDRSFVASSEGEDIMAIAAAAFGVSLHDDGHGIPRLVLRGELDRAAVSVLATEVVGACIDQPAELVIDLTALHHCDASGLRTLVRANQFCLANGVELKIIGANEFMRRLIEEAAAEDALPATPHPSPVSERGVLHDDSLS
jgi:anti-anti-sigma factor